IETSPEDLRGMIAAEGILTSRGGVSSHAALVARQMGKVCVCGASGIQIDYQKRTLSANGTTLAQGDYISIDGTAGEVFAGEVTTAPSEIIQVLVDRSLDGKKSLTYREYAKLMTWADEFRKLGVTAEQISRRVHELHEFNPMLGHRGCRLGITFPEISEMQARAIFEAAAEVQASGIKVRPEIMIPLVGFPRELKLQIDIVRRVADEVAQKKKTKFDYLVGTMIEIPRAALLADEIARDAQFFSFGT